MVEVSMKLHAPHKALGRRYQCRFLRDGPVVRLW